MIPSDKAQTVVFVGSRGSGKSTLITACSKFTDSSEYKHKIHADSPEEEDLPLVVRPILLTADDDESVSMVLLDTAIGDVVETQDRIKRSDMVVVVVGLGKDSDLQDVHDYWILDQLQSVGAEQPILLILNKADEITPEERERVANQWEKLLNHQLWEHSLFVSAKTGEGVEEMIGLFSDTLVECSEWPRNVLIDRYSDTLKPNFVAALTRVFRCLDFKGEGVLGYAELRFLEEIQNSELTADGFNNILQELNKISFDFVKLQGMTVEGFRYMFQRMTRFKLWVKCWTTLQYFDYGYDLTLIPRAQWTLPLLRPDQVIELEACAFEHLDELFDRYSQQRNSYISQDEISRMFSVLPEGEICPLLRPDIFSIFERDSSSHPPSLTKDGWMSYWVLVAAEWPERTLMHLSYLIYTKPTLTPHAWFRICKSKSEELLDDTSDRMLVRALIVSDKDAGKSTFARQLISERQHRSRNTCNTFCNRVSCKEPDQYRFLCLTEVQSNNAAFQGAMRELLPKYDLVILAYDFSTPKSFKVMVALFQLLQQYNVTDLPVQVLALKANLASGMTNQDVQRITMKLENLGLCPQIEIWLSPGDTKNNTDFDILFSDLVELGRNPGCGRVRPKPPVGMMTYVKRTFTISIILGTIYGMYRLLSRSSDTGPKSVPRKPIPHISHVNLSSQPSMNQRPKYPTLRDLTATKNKFY